MAYILPQVLVKQLFREVPLNTVQDQNCFVFGPNYQLFRYGDPATHDDILLGAFEDGSGVSPDSVSDGLTTFDYPGLPEGNSVDAGYVRLYAEDAVVELTSVTGFTKLPDRIGGSVAAGSRYDTTVMFADDVSVAGGSKGRSTGFKRDIVPGDLVAIDAYNWTSTVISVTESVAGEGYDTIRLAESLPNDLIATATAGSNGEIEFPDVEVKFLTKIGSVEVPEKYSDLEGETRQWRATGGEDGKFELTDMEQGQGPTLKVVYPAWDDEPKAIKEARLYLEYRVLVTDYSDSIYSIDDISAVETMLGPVDPDNPLALGVYKCIQNSADRLVYFMATEGAGPEDFDKALTAASRTDNVYIMVPLTGDTTVIDKVKTHCVDMSSAENKLWRIAFVSPDIETGVALYTKASTVNKKGVYATVTSDPSDASRGNVVVNFFDKTADSTYPESKVVKAMEDLRAGDILRVFDTTDPDTGEEKYHAYGIAKVLSNTSVRLERGPESPISNKTRVEVWHDYTPNQQVQRIASQARHYSSHRVYDVFPNIAYTDGREVEGYILAAACAGLASSVLPQQPITNVELTGIDSVSMVYETFSRAQLKEIAEGGVFIVMQDLPGDRVYVRHQLSTDYSSGNLLKSELSIVKNLDSISYYFAKAFKPYIGQYNITPELLGTLRAVASGALQELESRTSVGLYGPQVLVEGTEITDLYQGDVLQDHVYMHVNLNLPKPFNVLELSLEVI